MLPSPGRSTTNSKKRTTVNHSTSPVCPVKSQVKVSHWFSTVVLTSNSNTSPAEPSSFNRTGISAFGDQVLMDIDSDSEKSIGTSNVIAVPAKNCAPSVLVLLTTVSLVFSPDGSGFASTAASAPSNPIML